MVTEKFADDFRNSFSQRFQDGLGNEPLTPGRFISQAYAILSDAVEYGQVGRMDKSVISGERGLCEVLAIAGYLTREGEDIFPTHYAPTNEALLLLERVLA